MKLDGLKPFKRTPKAYTLAEVMISIFLISVMMVSLYAGFYSGFAIVKLSRENLRATQIMVQKMEAIRIYNWSQITNSTFLKTSFVDYYDPSGTNNNTAGGVVIINETGFQKS